jgi:WD40 repeat protein
LTLLDRDLEEIEVLRVNEFGMNDVAFSPDGSRIAIGVDGAVSVFKVRQ